MLQFNINISQVTTQRDEEMLNAKTTDQKKEKRLTKDAILK